MTSRPVGSMVMGPGNTLMLLGAGLPLDVGELEHLARFTLSSAAGPPVLNCGIHRRTVRVLRSLGISWRAMAAVAGVSEGSVRRVVDFTTLRVSLRTAERIFELEAVLRQESVLAAAAA
jgi:hypothetical protein